MPKDQAQSAAQDGGFGAMLRTDAFRDADQFYYADLGELNGSGVDGSVLLAYDEDTSQLTVVVKADGLEAGQVHLQHIHGFPDGTDAVTPTLAADADGDGFIELLEGLPDYGGILLNVALDHGDGTGGDNGHAHGDFAGFPTAPDGTITFVETYDLSGTALEGLTDDFSLFHFVIHGLTPPEGAGAGTGGEVNGSGDYALVLPVAVGEFEQVSRGQAYKDLTAWRAEDMNPGHNGMLARATHADAHSDWM